MSRENKVRKLLRKNVKNRLRKLASLDAGFWSIDLIQIIRPTFIFQSECVNILDRFGFKALIY